MKTLKYILGFLMLIGTQLQAQNQSAKEIFAQLQEQFEKAEFWSMDYEVRLYNSWEGEQLLDEKQGQIAAQPGCHYEKIMGFEQVVNQEKVLILDHELKTIRMELINKGMTEQNNLATWLEGWKNQSGISEVAQVGENLYVQMEFEFGEYEKVRMKIGESGNQVEKLVMYFRYPLSKGQGGTDEAPRMEVDYKNLNFHAEPAQKRFAMSHYLEEKDGRYVPVARLSDYRITN